MSNVKSQTFKDTERFKVESLLGSGGFGTVYQVYDQERNALVALKNLRLNNAQAIYRFKREFRSLANVIHPNLVTLYELISTGEQWFFTMELIKGVSFLEYLQNININTKFDALRKILKQLAEGLYTLHQAGYLHCDIKSSNVLVTSGGRLVLLDFGLVTELGLKDSSDNDEFIGSFDYMSPEQITNTGVSEASDWYSVGVMLYEALTGQLPFSGSFNEIITKKQQDEPLAPDKLVKDLPEDLVSLCVRLLSTNPENRPKGQEIVSLLGTSNKEVITPTVSSNFLLIGREHYIETLNKAFLTMKEGNPVIACVEGTSGIGKSVLVRHFLDSIQANETELLVFSGRCYQQETVPYKAVDNLIDNLSRYLSSLDTVKAKALLPTNILALVRLFPVLQEIEALVGAERRVLNILDSQELRQRAFTALRELLINITKYTPLVLFIDDLQWGDIDSIALLGELLSPPDPPKFLFIISYRSEEIKSSLLLKNFLPMLKTTYINIKQEKIIVDVLNPLEAENLALALLGKNDSSTITLAKTIADESEGNPFFIDELVNYSKLNNDLAQTISVEANPTKRKISLNTFVEIRVSQLSEDARKLLEIVAVAGQPIRLDIARSAAKLNNEDDPALLVMLRARHLVRTYKIGDFERIETYHDKIRETVVNSLISEKLKNHHYNLATILETNKEAEAETLAFHFYAAGELHKALNYFILAAEQASQTLAFDHEAELYQFALDTGLLNAKESQKLRVKLGNALVNAGYAAKAAQIYLACVKTAEEDEKLELEWRAAEQFLQSGYIDEGLAAFETILAKIGIKMSRNPIRNLVSILWKRVWLRLRGLKFTLQNKEEISKHDLLRLDICWSVSRGIAVVDPACGSDLQLYHLLLALKVGDRERLARAFAGEALYYSLSGQKSIKWAEKLIDIAKSISKDLDSPYILGLINYCNGIMAFMSANWKLCNSFTKESERIFRDSCIGTIWNVRNSQQFILCSLFYLGEFKEIINLLPSLLKNAQERGNLYAEIGLRVRITYIMFLAEDQPEKAREEVTQALKKWSKKGFTPFHYFALFAETESILYSQESHTAFEHISLQWPKLSRSLMFLSMQYVFIEALHLHARCAIAAAIKLKDPKKLLSIAENDIKRIEKENTPWGNALSLPIRAAISSINNNIPQALELLEKTEKDCQSINMSFYAISARRSRGLLLGGQQGQDLISSADNWIRNQKIKNPERITAMFVPGKWQS